MKYMYYRVQMMRPAKIRSNGNRRLLVKVQPTFRNVFAHSTGNPSAGLRRETRLHAVFKTSTVVSVRSRLLIQ